MNIKDFKIDKQYSKAKERSIVLGSVAVWIGMYFGYVKNITTIGNIIDWYFYTVLSLSIVLTPIGIFCLSVKVNNCSTFGVPSKQFSLQLLVLSLVSLGILYNYTDGGFVLPYVIAVILSHWFFIECRLHNKEVLKKYHTILKSENNNEA